MLKALVFQLLESISLSKPLVSNQIDSQLAPLHLGEALLAKSMGKKKVIAETGAGQHGRDAQPALVIGRQGLTTIPSVPVPAVLHNAVVLYRRAITLSYIASTNHKSRLRIPTARRGARLRRGAHGAGVRDPHGRGRAHRNRLL